MDRLLGLIVIDLAVVLFTNRFFKGYGFETEYGFATYWNPQIQGYVKYEGYFSKVHNSFVFAICRVHNLRVYLLIN